jgi:hypothetical protein
MLRLKGALWGETHQKSACSPGIKLRLDIKPAPGYGSPHD